MIHVMITCMITLTWMIVIECSGRSSDYTTGFMFNPKGQILSLEDAKAAVESKGGSVAALKCSDGIILTLARSRARSRLSVDPQRKIFFVDKHIALVAAGYLSDSSTLVEAARKECIKYRATKGSAIPIECLSDYLADLMHSASLRIKRALFVSILVTGWDDILGYQLYTTDPEGIVLNASSVMQD
jgi:20S proteasome subunit alpha 3